MHKHNLFRLLADNRAAPRRFEVVASANASEATLYLYDGIVSSKAEAEFWGGVDPETFATTLNAITAPVIHLRINSPGGDVFAARAMEQAIRQHPAQVIAHVDGYAASAASIVAIAADQVEISQGGFFMIHNAWTLTMGNAKDLMTTAALLDQVDGSLAATYAARTGQTDEHMAGLMAAETWFGAQAAVDAGLADRVSEAPAKAGASARWNMAAYANAPAAQAAPEPTPEPTPEPGIDIAALQRRLDLAKRSA